MTEQKQLSDDPLLCLARAASEGIYQFKFCIEESMFYMYKHGVWKNLFDLELYDFVNKAERINHLPLGRKKQVIEHLKQLTHMRQDKFNWANLFNLENGMVNPLNGVIQDHDYLFYSTNRIPFTYDEKATCCIWQETLDQIFEGDKQKSELLQEFFGYCLSPAIQMKKALLLMGESNTGKSTILFTLTDLLGRENIANVPLKALGHPQFTPMLVNKLVSMDTDIDKDAKEFESEFRKITSGEPIHCNQKFVKTFDFIPKCKIVLAANKFPIIRDQSSAFYNRLLLIPCNRIFKEEEQNRELRETLKQELPGILNWAIMGLRRLLNRKRFKDYDFLSTAVKNLEYDNNPVNLFFDEFVETNVSGEYFIEKGELYSRYVSWAKSSNIYVMGLNWFSNAVYKKYQKFTPPKTEYQTDNGRKRIWRNLKWINPTHHQSVESWQDEPR